MQDVCWGLGVEICSSQAGLVLWACKRGCLQDVRWGLCRGLLLTGFCSLGFKGGCGGGGGGSPAKCALGSWCSGLLLLCRSSSLGFQDVC